MRGIFSLLTMTFLSGCALRVEPAAPTRIPAITPQFTRALNFRPPQPPLPPGLHTIEMATPPGSIAAQQFVHIRPSTYGFVIRKAWLAKGVEINEDFLADIETFSHYAWGRDPSVFPSIPSHGPLPADLLDSSITDVSINSPLPNNPRGIVIVAPPFGPVSSRLITDLRRRKWAVFLLSYSATLSTSPKSIPADDALVRGELCAPELSDPAAISQEILDRSVQAWAQSLDTLVGATAPAVHDLLLEIERLRPQYRGIPIVILGLSMGALQAPAIATLLPRPPAALILIGGGANVPAIVSESDISTNVDSILDTLRQTPEGTRAVLDHMLFDPYHLAPALRHIPTLLIHAEGDGIVPAKYGDLLHERLGRPERWVGNFGHIWLFLNLPSYSNRIIDWIERTVPTPATYPQTAAPAASPAPQPPSTPSSSNSTHHPAPPHPHPAPTNRG